MTLKIAETGVATPLVLFIALFTFILCRGPGTQNLSVLAMRNPESRSPKALSFLLFRDAAALRSFSPHLSTPESQHLFIALSTLLCGFSGLTSMLIEHIKVPDNIFANDVARLRCILIMYAGFALLHYRISCLLCGHIISPRPSVSALLRSYFAAVRT